MMPLVVGGEELETESVNVRNRDDAGLKGKNEAFKFDEILVKLHSLKNERRLENKL